MASIARQFVNSGPSIARLSNRALLSVTGSQSVEFLNGLLATSLKPGAHQYSAFLHAQGRVMYDVFLHATDNGFIVEYDARESEAPPLLSYLKRHVLRSKVKIRPVTEEYDIWASWGLEEDVRGECPKQWQWARSGAVEPQRAQAQTNLWGTDRGIIQDSRGKGLGLRLLVRKDDKPVQTDTHELVTPENYQIHRMFHGIPEGSREIVPMHAFPMESNLDAMGGLDFRKGCYVGQELTVRTYHTGAIRKRILPFHVTGAPLLNSTHLATLPPEHVEGRDIEPVRPENISKPRPRGSGKLLSFQGGIGLALLRLEQVAALNNGELELKLEMPGLGFGNVVPWFPDWWPQPPKEDGSGAEPSEA